MRGKRITAEIRAEIEKALNQPDHDVGLIAKQYKLSEHSIYEIRKGLQNKMFNTPLADPFIEISVSDTPDLKSVRNAELSESIGSPKRLNQAVFVGDDFSCNLEGRITHIQVTKILEVMCYPC